MISFAGKSSTRTFIIATELGIIHTLEKKYPDKKFVSVGQSAICPNMKKITLEKILWALEDMQFVIKVPEQIRIKAVRALNRMLEVLPEEG